MKGIDFTNLPQKNKSYSGANGSKLCVVYNNEDYMLKFPASSTKNDDMSYTNGCVSEYIGCHIFESVGIDVQKTLLGTYKTQNGKEKFVVACRDFTRPGIVLSDFASLKNKIIDSPRGGYGTELSDVLNSIENQTVIDPVELNKHFWNIFIVDALIGNWDRHNGNWGFLYDQVNDKMTLAPIYDCGSSLYPQADEKIMKSVLENKDELNSRIYSIPTSALMVDKKRIRYFDYINSLENKDCNEALKRIFPKIDMEKIHNIVNETPYITELHKDFLSTMLDARYNIILKSPYQNILKIENKAQNCTKIESNKDDEKLSELLGQEYVELIMKNCEKMPIAESIKLATEKTYGDSANSEKILKQSKIKEFLNKKNINDTKDLKKYIEIQLEERKQSKKTVHKSISDDSGISSISD